MVMVKEMRGGGQGPRKGTGRQRLREGRRQGEGGPLQRAALLALNREGVGDTA